MMSIKRPATIVAIVALIVVALGALPVRAVDLGQAGDQLTPALARAIEFRRTFGLNDDPAMVAMAESDPDYSSENYGVPLSLSEEAELQRRVQVEIASVPAVEFAERHANWAGWFIDQLDRGAPVFLFAGSEASMRTALDEILPPGTGFRVQHVERTLAELQETQESIHDAWPELRAAGANVNHTAIHVTTNSVIVGIQGLTAESADLVSRRFGDWLEFREQAPAVADACPDTNCRPIKGGVKITRGIRNCTSGFMVRRELHGARLALLTAGHCLEVAGGINTNWSHSGDVFGNRKYETWANNSVADVGLIEMDDDETITAANKLWIFNGSTGATYNVTDHAPDNSQTEGSQACAYGYASNNSECVTVTEFDAINESCVGTDCRDILHTKEFSLDMISGDSGGPIYQVINSTNRRAMGTEVHGAGAVSWYSPYGWGQTGYLNVSGGDLYTLCKTAGC